MSLTSAKFHTTVFPDSLRALGAVMILTLLVYAPGMQGDFMFDDYPNIVENVAVQIQMLGWSQLHQAWNSGIVGIGGRALAMLTFGVNNAITGLNPVGFKLVNLVLHLLNGLLVFGVIRAISRAVDRDSSDAVPLWVTAAWLLHPVNLTPVLMVVQRMTELAALFTLAGVLLYLRLRRDPPGSRLATVALWLSVPLLWGLGFLAKENAVLAPLFVVVVEFFVLRHAPGVKPMPLPWRKGFLGVALIGLLSMAAVIFHKGAAFVLSAYADRDFTLFERLLTEARVVWHYVKQIVIPVPSDFNLFHDGLVISRSLLEPWTTLAAVVSWLLVLGWLIAFRRKLPMVALGLAWFMVGHLLESTVIPLELVFEHRNYVPAIGLLLAVGASFDSVVRALGQQERKLLILLMACLPLIGLAGLTANRAYAYASPLRMFTFEVKHNSDSYRAHQYLALALHEANLDRLESEHRIRMMIQMHLARAIELNPNVTQPYLMQLYMACRYGDPIDPAWEAALLEHWQGKRPYGERMHTMFKFANAAIGRQLCMTTDRPIVHFTAFTENPNVPQRYRAAILMRYAWYMHNVKQDRDVAMSLARKALATSADTAVKREYADFMHRLGESDEANRVLKAIPRTQRAS